MQKQKGLIIVLSGPSGVGKGVIRKKLMENNDLNLRYSISMTTRHPREGEENGVDYFFVTKEEFKENIKKGNFLEYATFVDNYYGTPRDYVSKLVNDGFNVLVEIDVQGAQQIKKNVKEDERVLIFILPPSFEELERRIRHRGTEDEDTIQCRLNQAKNELTLQNQYDFCVINENIDNTVNEIVDIIKNCKRIKNR